MDPTRRPPLPPRLVHQLWLIPVEGRPEIQVSWSFGTWMCSCKPFQVSWQPKGLVCRHIDAVQQRLKETSGWPLPTREEIVRRHWQL
jgi:hypothetical protein